ALPQFGVLARSEVGFLLWEDTNDGKVDETHQPGSRLKTPSLPVWVCCCSGHYGVLFNTNRELLRNYHAERRFDLYYYTCGGTLNLLSVDTRYEQEEGAETSSRTRDELGTPPLEKLIHTKWQGAHIHWNTPPLV
ncbi:unnamed protein product, partial [Timema podura]|nr:unnamed protein product [Timema podura]